MKLLVRHLFRPAQPVERKSETEINKQYPIYRMQILSATFFGYAVFYLVRNNLSPVAREIEGALHYDHDQVGNILAATAISYGLGKFFMGSLSDKSNPRYFMSFGLLLTAICNILFGATRNYELHMVLWAMNGLVQGMGWPPCGRSLGHWYSVSERGTYFAVWNIAHNIGGGLAGIMAAKAASAYGWEYAFYIPAGIAITGAIILLIFLRDTPQSVGLPPIEEYKNDYTDFEKEHGTLERELSFKELFVHNIAFNPMLWMFAFANFFVYITRYSMLDWGPTYLKEVKHASLDDGGFAILVLEFGGIPSTLLIGWLSDKLQGRRGMVSLLCMFPIFIAFLIMSYNPPGYLWIDFVCLGVIGFFVYPPVMLLGVAALDQTSKKAVGIAAGFVGLFGYIGRTVQAKGFGAIAQHYKDLEKMDAGWNIILNCILGCAVAAMVLLAFTWTIKPKR